MARYCGLGRVEHFSQLRDSLRVVRDRVKNRDALRVRQAATNLCVQLVYFVDQSFVHLVLLAVAARIYILPFPNINIFASRHYSVEEWSILGLNLRVTFTR